MDITLTLHLFSAIRSELLEQISAGLRLMPGNDLPPDMKISVVVTGHAGFAAAALNKHDIVVLVSSADIEVPAGVTFCRPGNITQVICDRVMSSDFMETHAAVQALKG